MRDSKTAKLELGLAEVLDTLASHQASITRLRSKYTMRDMRERKAELENSEPTEDDSELATAREKKALRLKAKQLGLLR